MIKNVFAVAALAATMGGAQAVTLLEEGFDSVAGLAGWAQVQNSVPVGTTSWFQGNEAVFESHSGAANSYIGANFNNTAGLGTIDNWLLTPEFDLSLPATLEFWTAAASQSFPDRLEVRISTNGASTSVGDFSTLLLTINPGLQSGIYPEDWTSFSVALPSLAGSGRVAFRYYVTAAGPAGSNSNYIGIDTVSVTAVPEPGTWLLMGAGVLGLLSLRRRAGR